MSQTKLATYIGFAVKSQAVVYGADTILVKTKKIRLILIDESINKTSFKKLHALAETKNIKVIIFKQDELSGYLHRPGTKAVGIEDVNLAKGIIQQVNGGQNE